MFGGATRLPPAARLERDLKWLRDGLGADSIQYFDHNFFDREADMAPLLEVMARYELPWWCYARADALLNLSASSWSLVRKSRLRMAYIGAESPNDAMLKSIRKGTRSDQTLAVAELCRIQGVIPELSFMVGNPDDPEGETERTFEFIRQVKRVNRPPRSSFTSTRRSRRRPCRRTRVCARWSRPFWTHRARRCGSLRRRKNGPNRSGWTTPAMQMLPG